MSARERVNSCVKTRAGAKPCVFSGKVAVRGRRRMVSVSAVSRLDRGKWSTKGARDCSESSISHKNCAERRRRKCWAHSRCVFAWRFWLQSFCQRPKRLQTFLDSFFHFFILSFIHSFIHSISFHSISFHVISCHFIHSFNHVLSHSFILSFIQSLIHSFIHSFHSFIHSFIHFMSCHVMSFLHSFIPSFIHSRIHSFMCSFHSVDSFLHSFFHAFHFCRPSFHFISLLPSSPTIPISKMFPIVMSFFLKLPPRHVPTLPGM